MLSDTHVEERGLAKRKIRNKVGVEQTRATTDFRAHG